MIGPVTLMGGRPVCPRYETFAPSWPSASTSGAMGLFTRLPSPVSVVDEGSRDAMPVMSLMVVPEFFASMTDVAGPRSSQCMSTEVELVWTVAPMVWSASRVAFVSSDIRGLLSTNGPYVRAPSTIALCVYDLDGGAMTVPFAVDDLTRIAVGPPPARGSR